MTPRACAVTDDRLRNFAEGGAADLDEHVAGCDECQAFLDELWSGRLAKDLTEPVMQSIRFELFLMEAAKLAGGAAADLGRAFYRYAVDGGQDGGDPA